VQNVILYLLKSRIFERGEISLLSNSNLNSRNLINNGSVRGRVEELLENRRKTIDMVFCAAGSTSVEGGQLDKPEYSAGSLQLLSSATDELCRK
jgi:hypothetical protein